MKTSYFSGFFSIRESEKEIILKRKWIRFPLHIFTLLIGGGLTGFFFNNEMIWQGILASFIFYWGLCGFFNVIKITINQEVIQKKNYPFPWFTNVAVLTKDFISASDSQIIETQKTQVVRVGGVNITQTLPKPIKSTTGYQVKLWVDKMYEGKKTFQTVDFQEFTVGDYEAADFLVLCLNKFSRKKEEKNN